MTRPALAALSVALLCACAPTAGNRPVARVQTGIDVLEADGFAVLRGKRVGLISNHTGRDSAGRPDFQLLAAARGVTLAAIFSPEHGFLGTVDDAPVRSTTTVVDGRTIPVYSLMQGGMKGMRPTQDELRGLDAVVFDVQDIGARFYTYLATMAMAMEEASKAAVEFYVLDRPNPINGVTMEGPLVDDLSLRAITPNAYFAVPIRHGMTAGEIALLYNTEVGAKLRVIQMRGWRREMWYSDTGLPWISPSPNIPDLDAATMYPGIGIFESSNLAVGRGTPSPFRWVGAPWLDSARVVADMRRANLPGIRFSAQDYTPSKSVFAGQLCHGVQMAVTDRDAVRPVTVFVTLERSIRLAHPKDFVWRWNEVKRMVGTERFHQVIEARDPPAAMQKLFEGDLEGFAKKRKPFLLY